MNNKTGVFFYIFEFAAYLAIAIYFVSTNSICLLKITVYNVTVMG